MFQGSDGKIDRDAMSKHVFIVNSETGENADALIDSLRQFARAMTKP